MREEERRKRLKNIEEITKEQRALKQKRDLFYKLKKNDLIKQYIRLEQELMQKEILTMEEVKKQEMGKIVEPVECNHDIVYYFSKNQVHSSETVTPFDGKFYYYKCLDCCEILQVKKEDNEEFLKMHSIIESEKGFVKCRNMYCSLLCSSHVDMAYQKLLKKI